MARRKRYHINLLRCSSTRRYQPFVPIFEVQSPGGSMSPFPKSLLFAAVMALALRAQAQTMEAPDITKQPTLYVVPYAHLDTQWRWEYPQVIDEYIRKTMEDNFRLFAKYPHYIFTFSGA